MLLYHTKHKHVCISRLSLLCCLVCPLQPCDHLLGKGSPFGCLVCYVFLCFVTYLNGVSGQVWYLIVSIPDLCLLYFVGLYSLAYIFFCGLSTNVHVRLVLCERIDRFNLTISWHSGKS